MRRLWIPLALFALSIPTAAHAGPCDDLSPEQRAVIDAVFLSEHPYDGCDDTFAACLKAEPAHPLVRRLGDWMCAKAARGADAASLKRSLERRGLTMMRPGKTHEVAPEFDSIAGCTRAPVRLTVYACARCPFCAKIMPELHREATSGRLAGRVALQLKAFPIKSHKWSAESNQALQTAIDLGRGWEFLLAMYAKFDGFDPDRIPGLVIESGLDKAAFAAETAKPSVRDHLVASKKEGLRNGVEATPTFYLNGRKFLTDLDTETVVDCVLEELETIGP